MHRESWLFRQKGVGYKVYLDMQTAFQQQEQLARLAAFDPTAAALRDAKAKAEGS